MDRTTITDPFSVRRGPSSETLRLRCPWRGVFRFMGLRQDYPYGKTGKLSVCPTWGASPHCVEDHNTSRGVTTDNSCDSNGILASKPLILKALQHPAKVTGLSARKLWDGGASMDPGD